MCWWPRHTVQSELPRSKLRFMMTYVNIRWSGIPSFSAQWTCANEGGFAMMAFAMNGLDASMLSACAAGRLSSKQERQHPSMISRISDRFSLIWPVLIVSNFGRSPGFLTIYAISFFGSPPISKNSSPWSSTNCLKSACVAIRIRCPTCLRATPKATNGWISPRDPTIWMTIFNSGTVEAVSRFSRIGEVFWTSLRDLQDDISRLSSSGRFMLTRPSSYTYF